MAHLLGDGSRGKIESKIRRFAIYLCGARGVSRALRATSACMLSFFFRAAISAFTVFSLGLRVWLLRVLIN